MAEMNDMELCTVGAVIPVRHGIDCKKDEHLGSGYWHDAEDDVPYCIEDKVYCGRCHEWLGTIIGIHVAKRRRNM